MKDPTSITATIQCSGSQEQLQSTISRVAETLRTIRSLNQASQQEQLSGFPSLHGTPAPSPAKAGGVNTTAAGGLGPFGSSQSPLAPLLGGASSSSNPTTTPGASIPRLGSFPTLPSGSPVSQSPTQAMPTQSNSTMAPTAVPVQQPASHQPHHQPQPQPQTQPQPQQPSPTVASHFPQPRSQQQAAAAAAAANNAAAAPPLQQKSPSTPQAPGLLPQQLAQQPAATPQPQQVATPPATSPAAQPKAKQQETANWLRLIDGSKPEAAARDICKVLDQAPPHAAVAIAKHFTEPSQASVIAAMSEPHRTKLRDAVLQKVLKALTSNPTNEAEDNGSASETASANDGADSDSAATTTQNTTEHHADMLMSLNRHNLVVLKGVMKTIDALLSSQTTFHAGVAVLVRLIAQLSTADAEKGTQSLEQLQNSIAHLKQTVATGCAKYPKLAYEQLYIEKKLGWRTPKCHFERIPAVKTHHTEQIVSSVYAPARDELLTGDLQGGLASWSGGDEPWTDSLPFGYKPCGMDVNAKGTLLAVGASSRAGSPALHLYSLVDQKWVEKNTISRENHSAITAVKCVSSRGAAVCVALYDGKTSHDISYHEMNGKITKEIHGAHKDYITCLATANDNENWLLSGSRDTTVRVWDARQKGGGNAKPAHELTHHTDTITGIGSYRDLIMVSSLDGSMSLWDTRKLKAPIGSKNFGYPLLRVAATPHATAVVATTKTLNLVTLHPLAIQDVVPNALATDIRVSHEHSMMFTTGGPGLSDIDAYSLKFAGVSTK